jgi:hypothetical protein
MTVVNQCSMKHKNECCMNADVDHPTKVTSQAIARYSLFLRVVFDFVKVAYNL